MKDEKLYRCYKCKNTFRQIETIAHEVNDSGCLCKHCWYNPPRPTDLRLLEHFYGKNARRREQFVRIARNTLSYVKNIFNHEQNFEEL